jgi:hypothetical protein
MKFNPYTSLWNTAKLEWTLPNRASNIPVTVSVTSGLEVQEESIWMILHQGFKGAICPSKEIRKWFINQMIFGMYCLSTNRRQRREWILLLTHIQEFLAWKLISEATKWTNILAFSSAFPYTYYACNFLHSITSPTNLISSHNHLQNILQTYSILAVKQRR